MVMVFGERPHKAAFWKIGGHHREPIRLRPGSLLPLATIRHASTIASRSYGFAMKGLLATALQAPWAVT